MCLNSMQMVIDINTVTDPGFGGRGSVNYPKQAQIPCSRHEVPKWGVEQGGWYPSWKENGNQKMLR